MSLYTVLLEIAVLWLTVLFFLLLVVVARSRSFLSRILALDTVSLVVIAQLAAIAQLRQSLYFLDAALVLALLSFVGTLAAVHYRKHDEVTR